MLKKEKIEKYIGYKGINQTNLAELLSTSTGKKTTRSNVSYHFQKDGDFSLEFYNNVLVALEITHEQLDEFIAKLENIDTTLTREDIKQYGLIKGTNLLEHTNKENLVTGGRNVISFSVDEKQERYLVQVEDDAMKPELMRADFVIIDNKESINDDDRVYLSLKNGKCMIRILKLLDDLNKVQLKSLNPEKSPTIVVDKEDIILMYRVVAACNTYYY